MVGAIWKKKISSFLAVNIKKCIMAVEKWLNFPKCLKSKIVNPISPQRFKKSNYIIRLFKGAYNQGAHNQLAQNRRAHYCWTVWHTLEKTGWCDLHQRILGYMTYIRENWGCDIHPRILGCVTYIRENWVVRHTLEITGWCDIHQRILGCVTY